MTCEKVTQLMEEYNLLKESYSSYSNTIVFLLETILRQNSLQYQIVSSRVKEESSLKNKLLDDSNLLSKINSITELDDIAGCRVIFYLESELKKFIHYVYNEFEVNKNNLRYSHDDYNATHLIIKFKEERLKLTEYAQFKGFQCELQLTTVLFHAWSEVSHNITYKTPKELTQFSNDALESLKSHLKETMKNFIKPANYRLEFIHKEYANLLEGRRIFDITFLNRIVLSSNRNEMYEKLLLLVQFVRRYGDKSPSELKLADFVKIVLTKSKKMKTIKSKIVGIGYEHKHVAEECLEILGIIKYQNTEQVFPLLIEISLDSNREIREKAINILSELAKYKLKVLQNIGFSIQYYILEEVRMWNYLERTQRLNIMKSVFGKMLEFEYEDTSMQDYKTFSYGFGVIKTGEHIKHIRQQIIEMLIDLFGKVKSPTDKVTILQILKEASRTPNRGSYSDDVESLVIDNTTYIINWYISVIESKETTYEIIKEIDEQINWFTRRFSSMDCIVTLKELIAKNERYRIYKDLVGYDHEYLEEIDWEKSREVRNEKITCYVDEIDKEKIDFWIQMILEISGVFTLGNQGKYMYYNNFLHLIGLRKPKFAKKLLTEFKENLNFFLHHIVAGLWISDNDYAREKVNNWIGEGSHLLNCLLIFKYIENVEIDFLEKIYEKAIIEKDNRVLNEIISLITSSKVPVCQTSKKLFISTINVLSQNNDFWWTNSLWFDKGTFLDSFNESEHDQILNVLIICPKIDYHLEQLLIPIANSSPKKIIDFFEKRIEVQKRKKKSFNSNYDAVPYHLNIIGHILNKGANECIAIIFSWYKKKHWLYHWEASDLFQKMFPTFGGELEAYLIRILPNKDITEAKIILQILKRYDGDPSIYNICKVFIEIYHEDNSLLQEIMHVLSETGVVTGEYGFANALKQIKANINKWNKSKNPHIRKFVKDFKDHLNACITAEIKRSDEQIEEMKQEFEANSK
ncbi:RelA/SpoT domain-containing protein [Brevibacillus choshinensis]|uniref:RelA/SpoT domain-containing protein n=1 Tax=Brevibacillus choshinensis TaxID=54911 RepID=UPI002E1D4EE4|nr:RelA/SpoT domain-containing protein [Brevibacillus choshinensis]